MDSTTSAAGVRRASAAEVGLGDISDRALEAIL